MKDRRIKEESGLSCLKVGYIHWIDIYLTDSAIGFPYTYPLDSDFSDG